MESRDKVCPFMMAMTWYVHAGICDVDLKLIPTVVVAGSGAQDGIVISR